MKTLLLGEETELEMPTMQPAAGNASLQHACHKLGPLEFSTFPFSSSSHSRRQISTSFENC